MYPLKCINLKVANKCIFLIVSKKSIKTNLVYLNRYCSKYIDTLKLIHFSYNLNWYKMLYEGVLSWRKTKAWTVNHRLTQTPTYKRPEDEWKVVIFLVSISVSSFMSCSCARVILVLWVFLIYACFSSICQEDNQSVPAGSKGRRWFMSSSSLYQQTGIITNNIVE